MSGRRQSKETQANNLVQTKKKPATSMGPVAVQPDLEELPASLLTSPTEASVEGQAARLGDARFQQEGQQRLARQVGKVGGNQHLQRVILQMRRANPAPAQPKPAPPAKTPGLSAGTMRLPALASGSPTAVQLRRETHVGAVESAYQLQDLEGGPGDSAGQWHKAGEGGYSRLMQGNAGEMVESMVEGGDLDGLLLRHVAPDLSGLPAEEQRWLNRKSAAEKQMTDLSSKFAPGSVRKSYQERYETASNQVDVIAACKAEMQQKTNQFNSFVPQGNAFYISAARLSSMQTMLGATDNASLASALIQGLADAEDVMERYQSLYDKGNRNLTAEKLDMPGDAQNVAQAADEMTLASSKLDTAYLGFQTTVLSGEIGAIKKEYAKDEERLAEINKVKEAIQVGGKMIDFTMSVVRGAPTMAANVTKQVTDTYGKTRASVNAIRNKRAIMEGKRPRLNPTYVTTDANGNTVVRNMQTRVDRDLYSGDKTPLPEPEGISLPTNIAEIAGKIADFVYAGEVEKINMRLEQMKSRVSAVNKVIDTNLFEQKIKAYQDALNEFALKAAALQDIVEDRRQDYRDFGTQLDRFAQVDNESREAGQGVARGAERYATIMTMVAGIREALVLGQKSQGAAPNDLPDWWESVGKRRISDPTEGEVRTVNEMYQQIMKFQSSVDLVDQTFGSVSEKGQELMGKY